ncbi:hypothetical protein Si089_01792 [Streptococcus infantarius subsp. infantarius]|uniref:hypothetical protein n=1 Tax=Streptococcus infantarius TaxID=102684 RepID=UPI001BD92EAC|nr:hypothetical protein [Streptococcus infantarius]MBT0903769.1 hypothetical protein [Streptococcus infantarius subsp. infantarius]MBT0917682.1 hypothetical protein [Streptococcus infantarius subsp. infantarius]MCO4539740.1 hypothetical protein [Streptococcus infantarius subsp. infantarius]MCO4557226.1 hypothetical protein [Streptococcus infantarius subsp. infantarius]MCO4577936.1 hypothetical protein [Streptococcus infantarius subsp. infantarius]
MDVQEILNRNNFLEDEVHRCYAEIEDYEVKTKEFETKIAGLERLLNRQCVIIADYEEMFDKIVERLKR